jgi:hypothetical protein
LLKRPCKGYRAQKKQKPFEPPLYKFNKGIRIGSWPCDNRTYGEATKAEKCEFYPDSNEASLVSVHLFCGRLHK